MPRDQSSVFSRQSSEKKLSVDIGQSSVFSLQSSARRQISKFVTSARSQTGVAQLALVLLLLAGVAVGTYVVQNRTNVSPNAAEPSESSGCKKVSQTGRSEKELADGRLEVTFTWADGRTTYDYKTPKKADGDRTLIGAQSTGVLSDGNAINKLGISKTTGNTITQGWSDGSVQYSTITSGTNHQGQAGDRIDASYMMVPETKGGSCSGSTSTTPKTGSAPKKGTAPITASAPKTNNAPKTNPQPQAVAPITNTTPQTAPAINTSATTATSLLQQFQTLQDVFNTTIVTKVASASSMLSADSKSRIDPLIAKTTQSLNIGIQSSQSCITSPTATCANSLPPLLNFSLVAVRLTAFSALFADIPEMCSRADFGITPAITAVSSDGTTGPIYVCSGSDGKEKKWRIFDTNNTPHLLNTTDSASWKTLSDPVVTAEFPPAFQAKFSQAVELVNKQASGSATLP